MTREEILERDVLRLIADSDGPVGSCALHEQLGSLGYGVSEPTIGRFLRYLDRHGYTERVSNRGRQLTEAGNRRVEELRAAHDRAEIERHLLRTMRPGSLDELLDVLVARRAIEKETARLAAQHATEAEIAELEATIQLQRQLWREGAPATGPDVHFHHLIAEVSRNRVLAAALGLIRHDAGIRQRLHEILQRANREPGHHHRLLVDAIKRRSPDEAEQAIVDHIDDLIARVLAAQAAEVGSGADGVPARKVASSSA
jgi:GntR family transcriptional repressor for pyruvate dehydrogenase complex